MSTATTRRRPRIQWSPRRAPETVRRGGSDRALALALILPALLLLLAIFLVPTVLAAVDSLFFVDTLTGARAFVGLDNFRFALASPAVIEAFGRTVLWTVVVVAGQIVLGVALALLMNQRFAGRGAFRTMLLFPYVAPAIVVALVWRYLLEPTFGLVNHLLLRIGVIDGPLPWLASTESALWTVIAIGIWKNMPFMLIMFLGRLQSMPGELVEAVRVDGGGWFVVFRYVVLPWLAPVIVITSLLRGIWSFNEFDVIYLLAGGGPAGATTTLPVVIRDIAFTELDSGRASAVALVVAVFLCVVAALCFWAYARFEKKF